MSEYPKFTFDKSRMPEFPPKFLEEFKEYAQRQVQYIPLPDPYSPLMPFEKFVELMRKRCGMVVIEEPTQVRQRLAISISPARESPWIKAFEECLKQKENGKENNQKR